MNPITKAHMFVQLSFADLIGGRDGEGRRIFIEDGWGLGYGLGLATRSGERGGYDYGYPQQLSVVSQWRRLTFLRFITTDNQDYIMGVLVLLLMLAVAIEAIGRERCQCKQRVCESAVTSPLTHSLTHSDHSLTPLEHPPTYPYRVFTY